MKKRRLADLYVTGMPVTVKDDAGNEVEVWLQKPNPVEHESCIRRANAARARSLMVRGDQDSEEWQAAYSEASDYGDRDQWVLYLISKELAEKQASIEAELSAEERWSTDNYLQGIYDAWEGDEEVAGLKDAYAKDPEDPEALAVLAVMREFQEILDSRLNPEIEELKRSYEGVPDQELLRKVTDRFIESRADRMWLREINSSELFYAVRDPENHNERYFDRREELDLLAPEVMGQLLTAYRALTVEPTEGKGSAGTGDSSPSSDQPATEETEASSGQLAVVP